VQCFLVVLFIMLYDMVPSFESVDEILSVTIQIKVTEQHFLLMLFVILYKGVLTFEPVDEILKCDLSIKSG